MAGHVRSLFVGAIVVASALLIATPMYGDEWTDFHFSINPVSPTDQDTFDLRSWRWFGDSGYALQDQSIVVRGNEIDLSIVVRDYHYPPGLYFLTVMTPVGAYFNDYGPLAAGNYQVNAKMWKTYWPDYPGSLFQEATFHFTVGETVGSPALDGDYNGDGVVDLSDYTVWRNFSGMRGADLAADGNHDEVVDDDDYLMWKNHFGETVEVGSMSFSSAAPEPGALLLVLCGTASIGYVRRR